MDRNNFLTYVDPLTDFGFARVFAQENNKDLLIDFLNAIIGEEDRVTDIEYLPVNQTGYLEKDRKAVYDIFCKNEKGERFVVEMQRAEQKYFRDRSLFYSTFPILKQAVKGDWDFNLKAVYMIAILDFVLFDEKKGDVNNYSEQVYLTRNRTKEKFTDKLNLIFVELPKFTKEKTELETNADRWLYSLKHAKELTSQPAEIKGKIFDKLYETLEIEQLTEEQMETYDKSILKYRDVRSAVELAEERYFARGIEEGIKRGIRQGIERGIERGLMSAQETFAKRCLQNNLHIEMVSKLTGLTPEQLIDIR